MKTTRTSNPKVKPTEKLGFGKYFTDHMLVMEYDNGKWGEAEIKPYAPFQLDPSTSVFHYGQAVFEGLKAYKNESGEIRLFRAIDNLNRMIESSERICIPAFDVDYVMKALIELIKVDEDWIPTAEGTSLYIRPSIIATEPALGVHASKKYIFFIILSPVGAYYANGMQPVKLFVEQKYVRASRGGTGHHKVIGNYAASLKAGEDAKLLGFDQVMWLDAKDRKYVEEVGAMNIFFCFGKKVVTPALLGSILPGVTRRSVIQLAKDKGYEVEEREVSIDEVVAGAKSGALTEIFGTGTAAVISPVGLFRYNDTDFTVADGNMGAISEDIYNTLTGIQVGKVEDKYNWSVRIK